MNAAARLLKQVCRLEGVFSGTGDLRTGSCKFAVELASRIWCSLLQIDDAVCSQKIRSPGLSQGPASAMLAMSQGALGQQQAYWAGDTPAFAGKLPNSVHGPQQKICCTHKRAAYLIRSGLIALMPHKALQP